MKRSNEASAEGASTLARRDGDSKKKRVKLTRQEKKKFFQDELTSKKIEKKLVVRARKDNLNSKQPAHICITLGKMAYDLARSGTPEHLDDLVASLPFLIPTKPFPLRDPVTLQTRAQEALLFGEAAYWLSLSGVALQTHLHGDIADTDANISTVLDLLVYHAVSVLSPPSSSVSSSSTQSTELLASKDISRMLEYFAIAGTGLQHSHFTRLAQAITTALALPKSGASIEPTLAKFMAKQQSSRGCEHFNSQNYWLHSPCGTPLTALWFHSAKQKKVRVAIPTASSSEASSTSLPPGTRVAKLSASNAPSADSSVAREKFLWGGDSPVEFADMSLPLVVDVGCGFGVSLLGLAAVEHTRSSNTGTGSGKGYNYLGGDLSSHCIAYASGLAHQWGIQDHCRFCVAPAEDFLGWVRSSYPGPVVWISVQFPTPYSFESRTKSNTPGTKKQIQGGKNSQLPSSRTDDVAAACDDEGGFMVTRRLIDQCADIALNKGLEGRCGIYFQSNVEDVAVTLRARFEGALNRVNIQIVGKDCKHAPKQSKKKNSSTSTCNATASYMKAFCDGGVKEHENLFPHDVFHVDKGRKGAVDEDEGAVFLADINAVEDVENIPRRQQQWIADGGERADTSGGIYLTSSPLPFFGHTETEVAYRAMKKPVHRVGWVIHSQI